MTGSCEEIRLSLGVHVLGALEPEETALVEAHLAGCAACRAERDELAGLPALLARVSESDVAQVVAPPRAVLDRMLPARARRRRRARLMLVAASAAVALVSGGGVATVLLTDTEVESTAAAPAQSQEDFAAALSAPEDTVRGLAEDAPEEAAGDTSRENAPALRPDLDVSARQGDIEARVRLYAGSVEIDLSGLPAGTECTLIAVDAGGSSHTLATWRVLSPTHHESRPVADPPARVTRFEILTAGRPPLRIPVNP